MTIEVGMKGIDFAFMPDHEGYAGIARNGAGYVSRYSAGVGGEFNEKCTKEHEIADAIRHGVDFIANFEFREDTREGGAGPGRRHGAADKDFWDQRGLARGAGVVLSWEPGNESSKFGVVADFLTAYKEAIGRPIGLYAGLQALLFMRRRDLIEFTWLPMSSAASGLNFGNITQREYAARMLKVAQDNGLNEVQNRNRWYRKVDAHGNVTFGADENIIVNLPDVAFSQMQAAGHFHQPAAHPAAHPTPHPAAPTHHPAMGAKLWQGADWPGRKLGFGPKDHFGNINGPDQSHGGATAQERTFVKMIQQRLVIGGFVPSHHDPHDGWADGIYDIKGDGRLTGATTQAVTRFQAKCRPGHLTTRPGEIWPDDWETLFNL